MIRLQAKKLKEILHFHQLPKSGSKKKLVDRIFRYYTKPEMNDNEVKLFEQIKSSQGTEKHFLHKIYKSEFNSQDILDKHLLKFLPRWRLQNWKTKVLISIILTQIINAWALQSEVQNSGKKSLRSFIEEVGKIWISRN